MTRQPTTPIHVRRQHTPQACRGRLPDLMLRGWATSSVKCQLACLSHFAYKIGNETNR